MTPDRDKADDWADSGLWARGFSLSGKLFAVVKGEGWLLCRQPWEQPTQAIDGQIGGRRRNPRQLALPHSTNKPPTPICPGCRPGFRHDSHASTGRVKTSTG